LTVAVTVFQNCKKRKSFIHAGFRRLLHSTYPKAADSIESAAFFIAVWCMAWRQATIADLLFPHRATKPPGTFNVP
jgi:hypothetical protein